MSQNLKKVDRLSQNLKKIAGLSRREDSGEGENPGKGLQGGMRRYGGGRKSMKEEKIETIKGNIIKIHKLKRKKKEKKIKGPKAKLKTWRNLKRVLIVSGLKKGSYWTTAMAWQKQLAASRNTIELLYILYI